MNKANAAAQIEADKARIAEKGLDDFQREFVEGATVESTYLFFDVETGDYADLERTIQAAEKKLLRLKEMSPILGFDYVALEEKRAAMIQSAQRRVDESFKNAGPQ